ncbi:uncharacterized protein METZ01_LOCUS461825, partial [marine metagenome]
MGRKSRILPGFVFGEFVAQGPYADAQAFCRLGFVPADFIEGLQDQFPFHL